MRGKEREIMFSVLFLLASNPVPTQSIRRSIHHQQVRVKEFFPLRARVNAQIVQRCLCEHKNVSLKIEKFD